VGLHAFHVTAGLAMLLIVLLLGVAGQVSRDHTKRVEVLAMYWHFVDVVWVIVFTVVYLIGR
jgi:cytochrome c oxidase subunit 3/cytochrome o ubiquinol oxidase subunit 3